MNFYIFLFRVALVMMILGVLALFRLEVGSAEFYVDIFGLLINGLVMILVLLKLKPKRR